MNSLAMKILLNCRLTPAVQQPIARRFPTQSFGEQSLVVPQSYGSQISAPRTYVSPQQQLLEQQQLLQQKIQESLVLSEAGRVSFSVFLQ